MSKDAPFALLAVAVIVLAGVLPGFAQALGLGEVTSQSTLGERLRVVVPLTGATGESVSDDCFTLISATEISDVTPTFLTAKVSLERSAQSRLVITTAHPINEPVLRLRLQADCGRRVQRDYVLLLDPPATPLVSARIDVNSPDVSVVHSRDSTPASSAAEALQANGSRDSRLVAQSPAERVTDRASIAPAVDRDARANPAASRGRSTIVASEVHEPRTAAAASYGASFWNAAQASPLPRRDLAPTPPEESPFGWVRTSLFVSLTLGAMVALLIGTFVARGRLRALGLEPAWMTRMRDTFPRSVTSLAARPVTLAAHADITTLAGEVVDPTRRSKRRNALPSRHRAPDPVVPSTVLRSLIGPLDGVAAEADIAEERAVREAWAAAQDEIESSAENKDVLRAIDDAERGMRLSPATPAQSAMDVALDEELLGHAEAKSSGSHPIDAPDLLNRPKHPSRDE